METKNLGAADGLPPLDWNAVAANLHGLSTAPDSGGPNRHTSWLTTINADGSPHVTAVGALWVDGAWWFQTGERTRKARNIARDPRCSMSVSTHDVDIVVEGEAQRVTDTKAIAALVELWNLHGWPCSVDEAGTGLTAPFNAPGLGPAPWFVYRIAPRSAVALGNAEPGGATRWRF
jgi:hypothetical protein